MWIIGCDGHTRYEQIAALETTTGELMQRRVEHAGGQAEKFYAALPQPVRVGMEATGTTQWFERLLARLGHELWVGDESTVGSKERVLVGRAKRSWERGRGLLRLATSRVS